MSKIIFSGIQPTGQLHLGNYLGALLQWADLQKQHQAIFCVVDYHAFTVPQNAKNLKENVISAVRSYLAAGIDPRQATVFKQSDIAEHTELTWLLNCVAARISDLENMTQYKDKAAKQVNPSVGLFDYPVLMAADILLYQTDLVPVGHDQLQHIELTRDLAKRFNHDYGETFKIPSAIIGSTGSRIMGLDDPTKKMSKSAGEANYIALTDAPEVAAKKIMRATTDSGSRIVCDPVNQPGIANLLTIVALLENKEVVNLEKEFAGCGYGEFKKRVADSVSNFLVDFQQKAKQYDDDHIRDVLAEGAKRAKSLAQITIEKVKQKLQLI